MVMLISTFFYIFVEAKSGPTFMFDPSVFAKYIAAPTVTTPPENDPYAALRGIPSPITTIAKEEPKEVVVEEKSKECEFPQDDDFEDDAWQGIYYKSRGRDIFI
jgi:hypothetical protein